jgi:probable rRNA maturation factor
MIISLEYVQAAAKKLNTTFEKRMNRMLIHSLCHLLGYDHIKDNDFKKMIKKEMDLAAAINLDCSWD